MLLLRFTNIVVRWLGATHDAFILANSALPGIMEGVNEWLLGDSGYPLKKCLLTPFAQPSSKHKECYNSSHCATRNKIIECYFRLHSKALGERVSLQAGKVVIPVFHNHGQYNGNNNDGFTLMLRFTY